MTDVAWLKALFAEVVKEANNNPSFAQRLEETLGRPVHHGPVKASRRRPPAVLDPFPIFTDNGEAELRTRLAALDVDQLKDIIAEHGMDQAKLAMKWKTPGRLIDLIITTVDRRTRKGDAFRNP